MEALTRKPFQGVGNIIRFNWHFFVLGGGMILLLLLVFAFSPFIWSRSLALFFSISIALSIIVSLTVSWFVYDYSPLYDMRWLEDLSLPVRPVIVNIHAGFDESSALIGQRYPLGSLKVLDFYDPLKHTEISIRRARRAYPAFPGTVPISTSSLVSDPASADAIFLILAAHEIRVESERIYFFRHLSESLKVGGSIIMVEHVRDWRNFLAYNIGFFHFHSSMTWRRTFSGAGLVVKNIRKLTPFLSIFILNSDGSSR